jgi:branched-chain amino acid transport system ATP-binding protein
LAADALVMDQVNTLYGDSHVLRDLSLTLREGSILALLGRNGVGKTTCISTIIGFVPPRDGRIEVFGTPIAGLSPEKIVERGVGLVPQGRRIFPTLTVEENLSVAAKKRPRQGGDAWSVARVLLTFTRLNERRQHLAGNLSGGEQQMLAIGRALMSNPRLLLLDEPSEGLAPQIVEELRTFTVKLKQEGISIVLVEQNSSFALDVADDAAILTTGGVSFRGTAEELRGRSAFLDQQLGVV